MAVKAEHTVAAYRALRAQPLWQLLAANNGPVILGLLQTHLYEDERVLAASVLHGKLARDLEDLRAQGIDMPQTAQAYVALWLTDGFLARRLPAGASEEVYELSTAAADAIRFVSGLAKPRVAATESRLSMVIQALAKLAEDTDTDKFRRVDRLRAEQDRIEAEIQAIEGGHLRVLPVTTAIERTREVIALAGDITGDFRRVRDQFETLNRDLRTSILDNDGSRGQVLDSLFAGIDLIAESEAGRTFTAFWKLLTDIEQSSVLESALDSIFSRDFARKLDAGERRFLLQLTSNLLKQGGAVKEIQQAFAGSLRHFVQSREYLEQRRLNQVLRDGQKAALALKNDIQPFAPLDFELDLTNAGVRSVWQLSSMYDPSMAAAAEPMAKGMASSVNISDVREQLGQSEIDVRGLITDVRAVLKELPEATVGDVLRRFPAKQGLGSVIGLIELASTHGVKTENHEIVTWRGADNVERSANVPVMYFVQEKAAVLTPSPRTAGV